MLAPSGPDRFNCGCYPKPRRDAGRANFNEDQNIEVKMDFSASREL